MPTEEGQGQEPSGTTTTVTEPQTTPPPESQGAPSEQQISPEQAYSIASDFLKDVPEDQRAIVEPFVKRWDAGVTRRFQELHSQLAPYKEFGSPEEIQAAVQVLQMIRDDPDYVVRQLSQELGYQLSQGVGQQGPTGQPQGQGQQAGQGFPEELAPHLTPIQDELKQLRQLSETMAQIIVDQRQSSSQAQEDAELEQYLSALENEFGAYDREYVLAKMRMNGGDGAGAVRAYKEALQQHVTASTKNQQGLPTVLSGAGAIPNGTQPVTELDSKATKNLVASIMSQAAREGQ